MRDYQTKANEAGLPDSITAEKLGAGEANSTLTESKTAVSSSGQALAPADGTAENTDQLSRALAIYGGGGAEYHIDTGAADAYVLAPVSPKKSTPAYFDGMTVSFKPGNDNTGASTMNVASLGVKAITTLSGAALAGGEIFGNVIARYNASGDRFELVSATELINSDITVTVGSGGDFSTLGAAVEFLSKVRPVYKSGGVRGIISILTGETLTSGLDLLGVDCGWIRIDSVDAEVPVTIAATFLSGIDAVMPEINTLFNLAGQSAGNGIFINNARIRVNASKGCKNAAGAGMQASTGAFAEVQDADFSGAGTYGVYAVGTGKINADDANVSNAGVYGVRGNKLGIINANGANASGAGTFGVFLEDSSIVEATGLSGTLFQATNTWTAAGWIGQ